VILAQLDRFKATGTSEGLAPLGAGTLKRIYGLLDVAYQDKGLEVPGCAEFMEARELQLASVLCLVDLELVEARGNRIRHGGVVAEYLERPKHRVVQRGESGLCVALLHTLRLLLLDACGLLARRDASGQLASEAQRSIGEEAEIAQRRPDAVIALEDHIAPGAVLRD